MKTTTIVSIVKYAVLIIALASLTIKFLSLIRYKARTNKPVTLKWIGWYHTEQVMGTSSDSRREFMQANNRLSTVMWICIVLLTLMYFLPE